MSPTFSRSSGNTTTVKGHVLWSWQKVRNVTPLVLSAACRPVPLPHSVVPTCLLASANETHSCLEDLEELRAEQTPLIVITAPRTLPSKQVRVRKLMVDQTQRNGIFKFYCRREGELPRKSRRESFAAPSRKGNLLCRGHEQARRLASRGEAPGL